MIQRRGEFSSPAAAADINPGDPLVFVPRSDGVCMMLLASMMPSISSSATNLTQRNTPLALFVISSVRIPSSLRL